MTGRPILYERAGADGLCPSPVCWRARIALAVKGVAAERRAFRFADVEQLERETGSRVVPVLAVDGAMIATSDGIASHLDSSGAGGPLLMADGAGTIGGELEREFGARIGPLVCADFRRRLLPEDREYYTESRQVRYGRSFDELESLRGGLELDLAFSLGRLEPRLDVTRYLAGDEVGWPDIVVYTYLQWIAFASPRSMPELVKPVRTWFERQDAEWRAVCLEPTIPPPADPEPAP